MKAKTTKTSKQLFAVKLYRVAHQDHYVAGFNSHYQIVQSTTHESHIKTWSTEKSAQKYVDKYKGAGFGMPNTATVVPFTPS